MKKTIIRTREEALAHIEQFTFLAISDATSLVNAIFDYVERVEESCDGCPSKPKEGENYPEICCSCKRFYGDHYGTQEV